MVLLYIPRQIEQVLSRLVLQFPALAVSGPRQSGKSTLLKKLFSTTHQYISFDDPVIREQAKSDPNLFLDNLEEKVILDEIQYVPEILSYIKIRIDNERHKKGRYLFTGSQKFALIKDLGDSLAGRIALLDLLPFDIHEKRAVPYLQTLLSETEECFSHACLCGSFPEPVVARMDTGVWYGAYLQTYLERDVRTMNNIGSLREFQQFMQLLAARCSQSLNLSHLSHDLGVGVNTVKRWVSILEASHIIYLLPPYYNNLGKRITKAPKVYFLDSGLVCYLVGIKSKDHLLHGPMAGALFENFCLQETVKVFSNRGIRPRLYYLRTHNRLEVDLLIEGEGPVLYPVEIKLSKTPKPNMASPLNRFKNLFQGLSIGKGRILSLSERNIPLSNDILVSDFNSYIEWIRTLK